MPKAAHDSHGFVRQILLVGRGGGLVKQLAAFKKSHHTVPDAVNAATQAFFARLCAEELAAEAEEMFQRARATLNYKRKDLALDVTSPQAVLTAKDFTYEITYALDEADPASYKISRSLHGLRSGDLVQTPECETLFAGMFTAIVFSLAKGVRVEAVIDAVEALDGETGLRVDYPSDCRQCTLTVEDVSAQVVCDGANLEMTFERAGSPAELIRAFAEVRKAFALAKDPALAGLL